MPRRGTIWSVVRAVKVLRLAKYSSEEIGDILKEDLQKKLLPGGEIVEAFGDLGLIERAFSEDLTNIYSPVFVKKASGVFFGGGGKEGGEGKNG
jgi:hypothetical protein